MMRAIVTGGASGIGAAIAALLRERGDDVVVLDRDRSDGIQVDVTDAAGGGRGRRGGRASASAGSTS